MTEEESMEQMQEAIKKSLDGFNNFAIVSWNTEKNRGFETMTQYSMMSNTDADTALMAVDAITTILIERKSKVMVKTDG